MDMLWIDLEDKKIKCTILVESADLKEGDMAKGGLHRVHLRVLCEKHMLDSRLAVVQWTVPRNVIAAAECVFC